MSALIIDDKGSSVVVESDSEVKKLQDLVRKLQVQNQMLLGHGENQSAGSDAVDNSPYVVDANCNTDLFQCKTSPALRTSSVLREQQLNSNNSRLLTTRSTDDGADSVHGAVDHSSTDGDALQTNAKVHLSLDTVQLVDVDGKLAEEEGSWSVILVMFVDSGNHIVTIVALESGCCYLYTTGCQ